MGLDTAAVRRDFPILRRRLQTLDGSWRPLAYFDHGASTHAPQPVIDAVNSLLKGSYANVHRGNHTLSQESSQAFEDALSSMLRFVGADAGTQCAILGQNTTMALDAAAHMVANRPGATLTTYGEHHSNDLPHRRRGPVLHAAVDEHGQLDLDDVARKLEAHDVKLLAVSGGSNVTGHAPNLGRLARLAHDHDALFLLDAAQLLAHRPIDVKPAGHPEHIDLLAAGGHKAYAPLGSAVLIGDTQLLDEAPPYMPGGGTVTWVGDDDNGFTTGPERHVGGTPNITGAIAFGAALDYLERLGMDHVAAHERDLTREALRRFAELEPAGVQLLGHPKADRLGVFSFAIPGVRHSLASAILDREHAVATRNGCFCAQPLMNRLLGVRDGERVKADLEAGRRDDIPGATRATLGVYNDEAELERLFAGIEAVARREWRGRYDLDNAQCHLQPGQGNGAPSQRHGRPGLVESRPGQPSGAGTAGTRSPPRKP